MIDIDPPHAHIESWRDILLHLAIIVAGILIAIGLEQTVEYFHHRHQVTETREALAREHDANRLAYMAAVSEFRRQNAAMLNNLAVLHYLEQHPGTPASQLPGILIWHASPGKFSESAWKTAQQSNVTALMPQDEVRRDTLLYSRIEAVDQGFDRIWPIIVQARLYNIEDPDPSRFTPAEVAKEIELTKAILVQHYTEAGALVELSYTDPTFKPALSVDDLSSLMHVSDEEHDPTLAAAIARTNSRLPPTNRIPIPETPRP